MNNQTNNHTHTQYIYINQRSFYQHLPDLLATLPPALLGLTEAEAARRRAENEAKAAMGGEEEGGEGEEVSARGYLFDI